MASDRPPPGSRPVPRRADRRLPRGTALGAAFTVVLSCQTPRAPSAPAAPAPSPAARPGSGLLALERRPADEAVRTAVAECVSAPPLVARAGCAMRPDSGTKPVVCVDLSPTGSPDVEVLSLVVAEGPYDFARTLGIPSMQDSLAGKPGYEAMLAVYRDFEGPHLEKITGGRQVKLEARGLMLGGVVHWATLPSPSARFTTALVRQIPLHDAPLADADRAGVEAWNLGALIACIDGHFWPTPGIR